MPELGEGRPATLHAIAATLGGEVYAGGRRASVPAPGHSAADRSVSLLLAGERLVVHSFGGASWQEVIDDLRARGLVDADHRLVGGVGSRPVDSAAGADLLAAERVAAARRLWAEGAPLGTASAAARHCRARGVVDADVVPSLRAHAAAPISVYRPSPRRAPALMAAAHDAAGALTAVEVTYLTDTGLRRRMRASRKVVGVLPPGSAVRLAAAGQEMLVAEGVFTTLAAMRLFGLPGWALLGAHNLARWTPPPDVRRVLIAADRGRVGHAAAAQLQATLGLVGLGVVVRTPPAPFGDWNDVLVERAALSARRSGS